MKDSKQRAWQGHGSWWAGLTRRPLNAFIVQINPGLQIDPCATPLTVQKKEEKTSILTEIDPSCSLEASRHKIWPQYWPDDRVKGSGAV